MKQTYRIAAINLGSSSTKVAYCENDVCIFNKNINHPAEERKDFAAMWDQYDYRVDCIARAFQEYGLRLGDMDAIVSRGGDTQPIPGGVYRITEKMVEQCASGKYGVHPTAIGVKIAYQTGLLGPLALTVNTPSTDEFEPLARYTGIPEISRRSSFHALNQKAIAGKYAKEAGRRYEDLNLVVVHMGGGISVVAHKKGRMVDGPNALGGNGPFSTDRCGAVPAAALLDLCYSGKYTQAQMRRLLNGEGGLYAYTGETDCAAVEKKALAGDAYSREVLEAMCYLVAKDIGAYATVLSGAVDAILLSGGMANSKFLIDLICERVRFIAPIHVYPGEFEMESLCENAYLALTNAVEIQEM